MFVARFMEIGLFGRECEIGHSRGIDVGRYLSLLGETVNFLNACTSDATFKDAIILLCVYIKRFIVDRWFRLRCMGRGGWILGER